MCLYRFALLTLVLGLAIAVGSPVAPAQAVTEADTTALALRYAAPTGHATASGEPYNPERMTLAHPTLPFGTLVELKNEATGMMATARVNDRPAPSTDGAFPVVISARAANQLGLSARGGRVRVQLSEDEIAYLQVRALREREAASRSASEDPAAGSADTFSSEAAARGFTVQLASFSDEARAAARADALRGAWVLPVRVGGARVYRVCYGVFATAARAEVSAESLRRRGIDGFVKSLDAPPMRTTGLGG